VRPIHITQLDKQRPALILTRELVRPHRTMVTIAPITSTIRGLSTEVPVGRDNGLGHDSVVSCDNITTVPVSALGPVIGYLLPAQETALAEAIRNAFDLDG
jgi:mRNA interferase MazF